MTWSHFRARRADRLASGSAASERGETLVELMCTIVLLGTGFVAVLSAIFTATNISDANQQRTRASLSVQAFSESLLQPARDPYPRELADPLFAPQMAYLYEACATPSASVFDFRPTYADGTLPFDWKATVEKVRYLQSVGPAGPVFGSSCTAVQKKVKNNSGLPCYPDALIDDGGGCSLILVDKGLQEITIRIDSGPRRDRVIDTIVLVKRDQRCPGTYDNADLGPC